MRSCDATLGFNGAYWCYWRAGKTGGGGLEGGFKARDGNAINTSKLRSALCFALVYDN